MKDTQAISQALAEYIRRQSGADQVTVLEFSRLSGGAIQSNYALTVECRGGSLAGTHALVVRSDSPSQVSVSLSRAQEFAVLCAAFQAGVTVPRPYWLCEDASLIGVPFCIMARVSGSANGRTLVRGGVSPLQAQALTAQLGTELARLHTIQPPNAGLSFLPVPHLPPAKARVEQYRQALDQIPEPHPVMEYALNWLHDNAPASATTVLCHCDFRTGNYMVDQGRLTGVLDWEFATWSDPYEDLGWLCSRSWRFGAFDKPVGGIGRKADLFRAYEQAGGFRVDPRTVSYWEVMALVRWAIIALQQAQRHLSGQEPSLELALTGRMLPEMEYDMLNQINAIAKECYE
ncbi:MAG: phosphotransferase family protein [Burkholderiaceae bacterium]|jgi:aminoglycoside phosphotransferase (APT) family kinase protein